MACDAATILAEGCETGISQYNDEIQLLRIVAQVSATQLLTVSPDSDVSVAAVFARACTGGIGKVQDETTLLQVIAEIGCEAADGEACSLSETLAGACTSGVGEFDSEIQLLRLWAQIYCAEETVVAPSAPVAEGAVYTSSTSMTVSWSDPSGTATSFRLDVSTDPLFGSFFGIWNDLDVGLTFSEVITGMTVNTAYYFRVRAVNAAGTSSDSDVDAFALVNLVEDTFESYSAGVLLNGLDGGTLWAAPYVSTDVIGIVEDTFESYADADPLDGLNGGENWAAAYVSR